MASERSKRRDFLSLSFITKSISTKLLIKIFLNHPYKILLFFLKKKPPTTAVGKIKTSLNFTSKCWMTIIDMELVFISLCGYLVDTRFKL